MDGRNLNATVEQQEQRGNDVFLRLRVGVGAASIPLEVTFHDVASVHSVGGKLGVVRGTVPVFVVFQMP